MHSNFVAVNVSNTRKELFFLLIIGFDFLGLVLLSESLDDIEDDDDVDGEDGEDGGSDGGDWRLVLPVLQDLLGSEKDADGQEEHQHGVEKQSQQSLASSLFVGSCLEESSKTFPIRLVNNWCIFSNLLFRVTFIVILRLEETLKVFKLFVRGLGSVLHHISVIDLL